MLRMQLLNGLINKKKRQLLLKIKLQSTPQNPGLVNEEKEAADSYNFLKNACMEYLKQKAKSSWLSDGDENTGYFHSTIKARRSQNKTFQILDTKLRIIKSILKPKRLRMSLWIIISILRENNSTHPIHVFTVGAEKSIQEKHVNIRLRPVS
ncbi:hypothetical protein RND81_07G005400 [Saponaria officinalis]|uniref:Uncharacterized protein n=1 Tax=Saponaria officinalis TaxID=3572 RepID=A0AAW1JP16_SAPOF